MAFIRDEPAADDVEAGLRDQSEPSRISALNLAEIVDVMTRIFRSSMDDVLATIAVLEAGGLEIVPVDRSIGIHAARIHARYYDRSSSPLSMADCVALATAAAVGEPLATSDEPLAMAAAAVGVSTIGLPDSQGRLPGSR
jgi:uncharacterized protein with PIN domain